MSTNHFSVEPYVAHMTLLFIKIIIYNYCSIKFQCVLNDDRSDT